MTWQAAYEQRHDDLGHAHNAMRSLLNFLLHLFKDLRIYIYI